jgi:malate dehydrogenase (oxaloacetate-decarboxylating)
MNAAFHLQKLADRTIIRTSLSGFDLLQNSRLNKGTAFTEKERDTFHLHGLLPPSIGTLEEQRNRRKKALECRITAFGKYSNMRDLQDNCEIYNCQFCGANHLNYSTEL